MTLAHTTHRRRARTVVIPFELALLRRRLASEEASLEALADRAFDVVESIEGLEAQIRQLGRKAPRGLRDTLATAKERRTRIGSKILWAERKIERARAEIEGLADAT